MITKNTNRDIPSNVGRYLVAALLCFHFGAASAQNDPYGPQPKKNAPNIIPTDPLKVGSGVNFNSIEDLPPGLKEIAKNKHAEFLSKGHMDAPDSEVTNIKNLLKLASPLSSVEGNLKVKLSTLNTAAFNNLKFEGIFPEGPTRKGPWTSVSRIYTTPNGAIIQLHEWDYVADGGGITIQKEMVNESINGRYPAVLSIEKSAQGNALTTLAWATERKIYRLSMTGHVKGNGMYTQFMNLANSIRD